MFSNTAMLAALIAIPTVGFAQSSPPATKVGCLYEVEGVGGFTQTETITFDNGFPSTLQKSDDTIGRGSKAAKFKHRFLPANVAVNDGFLDLTVPGGQTQRPVTCAEVSTSEDHIFYASVRTTALFSNVPGTVHGNFFYHNDSQEIDIEYVTDRHSGSNPHGHRRLQLTNQAANDNPADATFATSPAPANRTTVLHEYRIDWIPGMTIFYLDGQRINAFTTNVPTIPGPWVWNNWCNGDPGFSVGPPPRDNVFKLQQIVMYYNTTTSQGTC